MGGTHEDPNKRRPPAASRPEEPKILRTGTFLHTSCPVCGCNMVHGDWILFHAVALDGTEGELKLSDRFNVFDKLATFPLRAGEALGDLQCPRCRVSLLDPIRACERCGAKTVKVRIEAVRLAVNLYICTRTGCRWHGISQEDSERVVLDQEP